MEFPPCWAAPASSSSPHFSIFPFTIQIKTENLPIQCGLCKLISPCFYFVRASSAFYHSYGKGATKYQMQYIIIIIIISKRWGKIFDRFHAVLRQNSAAGLCSENLSSSHASPCTGIKGVGSADIIQFPWFDQKARSVEIYVKLKSIDD
jgi:hypothetical protein